MTNSGLITGIIDTGKDKDQLTNSGKITTAGVGTINFGAGDNEATNQSSGVITVGGGLILGAGNDTVTNDGLITGNINLGGATTKNILTNNGKDLGATLGGIKGDVKLVMGGVYGGFNLGGFEVSGGISYADGKQKVSRHIGVGTIQRDVRGRRRCRNLGWMWGWGMGLT